MKKSKYDKNTISPSTIRDFEIELKQLKREYEQIQEWLLKNTTHPDFMKKVSERNDLSVRIEVKKQQVRGDWFDFPSPTVTIIE